MRNKLVIIQLEIGNYICYELNNKTYQYTMLNYNNIIPFVSKKIKNCDIYFDGFSRAEIAHFQTNINNYWLENKLNVKILNNANYFIFENNISVHDYIIKNKLKPKENKRRMLIMQNEEKYICYEFDNKTYSITTLNAINMIPKISNTLDKYYVYFSGISRAELAHIINRIRRYYEVNNLDINILDNSVFTITNQKDLVKDIITNRKFVKKFDTSKTNKPNNNETQKNKRKKLTRNLKFRK